LDRAVELVLRAEAGTAAEPESFGRPEPAGVGQSSGCCLDGRKRLCDDQPRDAIREQRAGRYPAMVQKRALTRNESIMRHKLAIALVLLTTSLTAAAAENCIQSGTSFAHCARTWSAVEANRGSISDPNIAYETGVFEGYIEGVAPITFEKTWCPRRPFTDEQVMAIVARFLEAHPEAWSQQPEELVGRSLSAAFPCR
jgi:hypothetical protein